MKLIDSTNVLKFFVMIEINKIAEYIKYLEERNEGIQDIIFTINKNGSGTFEDFFNGYIFVSFDSLEELEKILNAQTESQSVNGNEPKERKCVCFDERAQKLCQHKKKHSCNGCGYYV